MSRTMRTWALVWTVLQLHHRPLLRNRPLMFHPRPRLSLLLVFPLSLPLTLRRRFHRNIQRVSLLSHLPMFLLHCLLSLHPTFLQQRPLTRHHQTQLLFAISVLSEVPIKAAPLLQTRKVSLKSAPLVSSVADLTRADAIVLPKTLWHFLELIFRTPWPVTTLQIHSLTQQ